jgi:hypothetical protein
MGNQNISPDAVVIGPALQFSAIHLTGHWHDPISLYQYISL